MMESKLHRLLGSFSVLALVSACSSTPIDVPPEPKAAMTDTVAIPPAQPRTGVAGAAGSSGVGMAQGGRVGGLSAAAAALAATSQQQRSVYFDFDNYAIDPTYQDMLAQHAKVLVAEPSVSIRIEGHADDRGSAEYNLALGQRRAEAVKRALNILGVPDQQLRATSWGEEKPQATGEDESAWARNRFAELVYPSN